jgi:putative tricarboxylic transport membrane protein
MAKIGDSPTATELGIPVSLSTVRGFVTKKGAPAERVKELEAGMLKAMGHNYYKNFLTEIGLDESSEENSFSTSAVFDLSGGRATY